MTLSAVARHERWLFVALLGGLLYWTPAGWCNGADPDDNSDLTATNLQVSGEITASGGIALPNFTLRPGGVLEWPNKLHIGRGGGEEYALPPQGGKMQAQPGGSLVIFPLGDYMRSAIDLIPTQGQLPWAGALGELTIHRFHPTPTSQEMISFSALGEKWDAYAVIPEAHGRGKLKPLIFLTVQGGLNPGEPPFLAEAMRITEKGTVEFGRLRQGGTLQRPVNSITLEQPEPRAAGTYDSDYLKWVGKASNGAVVRRANWRFNVKMDSRRGRSTFVLQNSLDDDPYANKLEVTDRGDLEVPTAGSAIILRSPNGKRWRVTVDDSGQLQVRCYSAK